jgi:hypothetical protein
MLVHCADIPTAELAAFEQAIRASGKDPRAFKAQMFEATLQELGATQRRVHVATRSAAAQYEASAGRSWIKSFARHLAKGVFG